jgi:hypothetical protein
MASQRHSEQHRHCLHSVIPAKKAGIQENITVHGERFQEMVESLEDKMDRAQRSRVEGSSWRDLCSYWIPAFFAGMTL